jgi:hypothetical protein
VVELAHGGSGSLEGIVHLGRLLLAEVLLHQDSCGPGGGLGELFLSLQRHVHRVEAHGALVQQCSDAVRVVPRDEVVGPVLL